MNSQSTALLIDDDPGGLTIFSAILRHHGFDVLTAEDGRSGVSAASRGAADVILLDLRLPDFSGIEALRQIRQSDKSVPVIIMTAYATMTSVVQSMRLGAVDYLEKPLSDTDLLQAVEAALGTAASSDRDDGRAPARHAAGRWAEAVVRVIDAPEDPRTVRLWGRHIGASPGSLRNWCHMAGVSPKRSLSVARMLRAVLRSSASDRPEEVFDVVDRRTLFRLMKLGDASASAGVPRTIEEFFARQRWVTSQAAVDELRRAIGLRAHAAPPGADPSLR